MSLRVIVRGGGDLASGVILRLARIGCDVYVTELEQPLAVRRLVSFSQAIYAGAITIEGVKAKRVEDFAGAIGTARMGEVPVMVDPECKLQQILQPDVLIDARMSKQMQVEKKIPGLMTVGLGPGFTAPLNCDCVIETKRGPFLGRAIWDGSAEKDTGLPDRVGDHQEDRVLRAPLDGRLVAHIEIGSLLKKNQLIAEIAGQAVLSPFDGVLRGLIQPGLWVPAGLKIGDVDPRSDPRLCWLVSDKALAIGGGVLEAVLSRVELREKTLWEQR